MNKKDSDRTASRAAKKAWKERRKRYGETGIRKDTVRAAIKAWDKRKEKYGETGVKGGSPAATRAALKAWATRRKNVE